MNVRKSLRGGRFPGKSLKYTASKDFMSIQWLMLTFLTIQVNHLLFTSLNISENHLIFSLNNV